MASYVAGDGRAFARLFSRLAPHVQAFFRRSFRDAAVADELMQVTFLHLHRARGTYEPSRPFRPWLFTIAAHVRRDEWRRRLRQRSSEDAGDGALLAAEASSALSRAYEEERERDLTDLVRLALDTLPDQQRIILRLHRFEGLTFREIAAAVGSTSGAVRQQAFRAYESLRQHLLVEAAAGARGAT